MPGWIEAFLWGLAVGSGLLVGAATVSLHSAYEFINQL